MVTSYSSSSNTDPVTIQLRDTYNHFEIIFFDFGGVLSPPISELFIEYERKTGISPRELKEAMMAVAVELNVDLLTPIECALLTEHEWMQRVHYWLKSRGIDISRSSKNFGWQWFEGHKVNSVMRNLAVDLHSKGYKIGILTNNVREWEKIWRQMVDLEDIVHVIIDSSYVGCRKPESEIFAIAEQNANVISGVSLLIDDIEENCLSAKNFGWEAIQFIDNEQVISNLHNILTK